MAAPHVAGVAALLWSADPTLIGDVDATEALICETANPRPVNGACTIDSEVCACGNVTGTPNNVYGCGFVNAGAAVKAATDD